MYYGLLTKMNGVMGYRKRSRIDNCLFISYLHDKLPFMLLRIRVSNNFGDKHGLYKTPLLYQELFEKLLELLVLSTHSPKGRFSKDNSYIIFKKKMETTKDGNTVKLVLPFPHFLWILANQPEILKGKANKVNKNGEDNK